MLKSEIIKKAHKDSEKKLLNQQEMKQQKFLEKAKVRMHKKN